MRKTDEALCTKAPTLTTILKVVLKCMPCAILTRQKHDFQMHVYLYVHNWRHKIVNEVNKAGFLL